MKLNFWQMIGAALLVVGLVWLISREVTSKNDSKPAPTTQPAPAR